MRVDACAVSCIVVWAPHDVARPIWMALDDDTSASFGRVRAPVFGSSLKRLLRQFHCHAHSGNAVPTHQSLLPRTRLPARQIAHKRVEGLQDARQAAFSESRTDVDTLTDISALTFPFEKNKILQYQHRDIF